MIKPLSEQYVSFLHDESRLTGEAADISFPQTVGEVKTVVAQCLALKVPITVQGARTGICGGAVPRRGHLMNLSEMNKPLNVLKGNDGAFYLTVQPGYLLSSLRRDLRTRRFEWLDPALVDPAALAAFSQAPEQFWPPDPSELTASIGGIASTNSRGPGAFKYGSADNFIAALQVVTNDAEEHEIKDDRDLLEAFIGGEGMLGVITALTLRLQSKPSEMWGIGFFFNDENKAAGFMDQAVAAGLPALAALDFLDAVSLTLAGELKQVAAKLREIPETPPEARAAVYIELHGDSEGEIEIAAQELMEAAETFGSDPDTSWALSGDETEKLRLFRHAVPEAVNTRLDQIRLDYPGAVKMGGDLTWPGISFAESLAHYRRDIEKSELTAVIFGHARDNHLHVNLLPRNEAERQRAADLMAAWLDHSRELNGRLFREHGVGKIKSELFLNHEQPREIQSWRELKDRLDPDGLWNPGNMFQEVVE